MTWTASGRWRTGFLQSQQTGRRFSHIRAVCGCSRGAEEANGRLRHGPRWADCFLPVPALIGTCPSDGCVLLCSRGAEEVDGRLRHGPRRVAGRLGGVIRGALLPRLCLRCRGQGLRDAGGVEMPGSATAAAGALQHVPPNKLWLQLAPPLLPALCMQLTHCSKQSLRLM